MHLCSDVCSLPTGELSQRGTRNKDEVASLQNTIATLDREKDALQDEVDHKTEKVVALQEENCRKVHKSDNTACCKQTGHIFTSAVSIICAMVWHICSNQHC